MDTDFSRESIIPFTPLQPNAERSAGSVTPAGAVLRRVVDYLISARRRWGTTVGILASGVIIGVITALMLPSRYPSGASFVPDGDRARFSLSGALAGLSSSLGMPGSTESPQFYAELLVNRELLTEILHREYGPEVTGLDSRARLIDTYELGESDSPAVREIALQILARRIGRSVDPRTGIVSFTVEASTPELARALAIDLLAGVNDKNLELRRARATAQQHFMESRVTEAATDLRRAEDALRQFLMSNRTFQSPELQFEQERLRRSVELQEALYRNLRQELDQASLDASRNTPSLLVLSEPVLITKRSFPKRRLVVVAALVIALLALLVILRVQEHAVFASDRPGAGSIPAETTRLLQFFGLQGTSRHQRR